MRSWQQLSRFVPWARKSTGNVWDIYAKLLAHAHTSKAGEAVSWESALRVATVLACARVIAQGLAQVPFKVFQESADGASRLPARDHPLYDLLHATPNPWQTSFEYRETIALHLVLRNRHYSFINRGFNGEILELIPLQPQLVTPKRADDGMVTYEVRSESGTVKPYPAEAIWHVRRMSWNGWEGLDAIQLACEAIGLAMAAEAKHARFHKNGVQTSGTYSVEGTLKKEQYEDLRRFIVDNHVGENAGLPMIVDRGAKWLQTAMSGVDAQHLETRRFQVEEVCRALGVMPVMVFHYDKGMGYNSFEHQAQAHVVHTMAAWYTCIEQSVNARLLTKKDRAAGLYSKFVVQGLLRGSTKDRAEYFAKALGAGGSPAWMTQDEVRALEELNPFGGDAAVLPKPTNVGGAAPVPEDEPQGA